MATITNPRFPTIAHEQVTEVVHRFFALDARVDTVLIVNSCARGHGTPDSDLDLAILVKAETSAGDVRALETSWLEYADAHPQVAAFKRQGRFSAIHLDIFGGRFAASEWDDGGGPDSFELELGNHIAYAAPKGALGPYFERLQSQWLPYYPDELRRHRLAMIRDACLYDIDHVPHFAGRGLHFQAFDRLYKAFQEFLQGLFVAQQVYPVAYNKWIHEQVVGWLGLPELYAELPRIVSVSDIQGAPLLYSAARLRALVEQWLQVR